MADRFELDKDAAVAAGERAKVAGENLLEAHRKLVAVLDDHDGCWGNDDIGKAFADKYVQTADSTRKNTEVLAVNLVQTGQYIVKVAKKLADVDEDNAQRFDRFYADNVESWTSKS